jgi:predicted transcriptional regulator
VACYVIYFYIEKSSDLHQVEGVNNNIPMTTRAGVTLSKYRNQMAWRRNKVKELLARGHRQYDIANTLHISQPTISRDIHYVQMEMRENAENYGDHLFKIYSGTLLGLDETVKKLWTIIDLPSTDNKDKVKAISLINQYYKDRFELSKSETDLFKTKKCMDFLKSSPY